MKYCLNPVRIVIIPKTKGRCKLACKDKETLSSTVRIKIIRDYGEQYRGSLKETKIKQPYDLSTPVLDIYPNIIKSAMPWI